SPRRTLKKGKFVCGVAKTTRRLIERRVDLLRRGSVDLLLVFRVDLHFRSRSIFRNDAYESGLTLAVFDCRYHFPGWSEQPAFPKHQSRQDQRRRRRHAAFRSIAPT